MYAVGYFNHKIGRSVLAHWDGMRWHYLYPREIDSTRTGVQAGDLIGVYGIRSNRIWVVGGGYGRREVGGPDTTWGFIAEWNGTTWKNISPVAIGEVFLSVWASSERDVWVGSMTGAIYRYDGTNWTKMSIGYNYHIRDIWGFSNTEVYASCGNDTGTAGGIFKYNGEGWERLRTSSRDIPPPFKSVWGLNSRFLFGASDYGLYSNSRSGYWETMVYRNLGGSLELWKVRGSALNNVFACGYAGTIVHYNGSTPAVCSTPFSDSETWRLRTIQIFGKTVFIGGFGGHGFDVRGIVLRGRLE